MDYSSVADSPVPKSFDNLLDNDHRGNFLVQQSSKCFNRCVTKIVEAPLNENEVGCLNECFTKSYLVYDYNSKL